MLEGRVEIENRNQKTVRKAGNSAVGVRAVSGPDRGRATSGSCGNAVVARTRSSAGRTVCGTSFTHTMKEEGYMHWIKRVQIVLMGSLLLIGTLVSATMAQTRDPRLSDSQEPGSVLVFPKFIRGTVTPPLDGLTPATEIAIGAVCPPGTAGVACFPGDIVAIHFHWVCPPVAGSTICRENDFHGFTTIGGKLVFNTEGTQAPGNFTPTAIPPCARGYLIAWVEDANTQRAIKFDGLIGDAVLRESNTSVTAYNAIPIQADTNWPLGADIVLDPTNGALVFDGVLGSGHYQAVTGRIYGDVTYEKLTGPPFRNTFLTLLTLDVRSGLTNTPTFVPLKFFNSQEHELSTSTNFTCWVEVQLSSIDVSLTGIGTGSRKGVFQSGVAVDSVTFTPRTLLGFSETLEGTTLPANEREYISGFYNDSVVVPTRFFPAESF